MPKWTLRGLGDAGRRTKQTSTAIPMRPMFKGIREIRAPSTPSLDLINELDFSSVVLAGHSMGARVILATWQQAQFCGTPSIEGLCFVDGSNYGQRASLFAFDSSDSRSISLSTDEKHEKIAEAFARMFSSNTSEDSKAATMTHVKSVDIDYNEAMRRSFISWDYERMDDALDAIGRSGLPVLSIQATTVGEQNQRIALEAGERSKWMEHLAERVPRLATW